jgi:hypothetical protein
MGGMLIRGGPKFRKKGEVERFWVARLARARARRPSTEASVLLLMHTKGKYTGTGNR